MAEPDIGSLLSNLTGKGDLSNLGNLASPDLSNVLGNLLGGGLDLSGIMSSLQGITAIVGTVVLVLFSFWIGRKALSGYKKDRSIITSIVGTLILGVLCLIIGLIIGYGLFESLGLKLGALLEPVAEFIGVGIAAAFFYILLRVVFAPTKLEVVTRKEFEELKKEVNSLKEEVYQITKRLIEKKIVPKISLLEDAITNLKKALEEKEIKNYKILKSEREGDNWVFSLGIKFSKYKAVISSTGALREFEKEKIKILDLILKILKNKRFIGGIILVIIFYYMMSSLWTTKAGIKLNEYLGIGLKCYKISELEGKIGIKSNNTAILNIILTEQSEFNTTKYSLKKYEINKQIYYLIEGNVKGEAYSCSLLETEICECTTLSKGGDLIGGLFGKLLG